MQAYKADTAWKRGIPCIFFKVLIQLYLLCSFLYYLTYCIKEVINGKIFWRLNEKTVGLWGSYGLKQGNAMQFFQNTHPILFVLFISLFLTYCIKEGIKGNMFGHYIYKCWPMRQLRPETGESLAKPLKFQINIYLVLLNGS